MAAAAKEDENNKSWNSVSNANESVVKHNDDQNKLKKIEKMMSKTQKKISKLKQKIRQLEELKKFQKKQTKRTQKQENDLKKTTAMIESLMQESASKLDLLFDATATQEALLKRLQIPKKNPFREKPKSAKRGGKKKYINKKRRTKKKKNTRKK